MGYRKNNLADTFIEIEGRKKTFIYDLYNFLCIISFGLFYMICKYSPKTKIFLTTRKCDLKNAELVVIKNKFNKAELREITIYKSNSENLRRFIKDNKIRVLDTEYARLIYDVGYNKFVLFNKKKELNFEEIYLNKIKKNQHEELIELDEMEILYGKNINNLRLKSIMTILIGNTFNITNFIDIFCVVLWFNIQYKIYGSIVALFRIYSYLEENYLEIKQKYEIEASINYTKIKTLRNGKFKYIESYDLFPGDLVYIETCKEFPADVIILKGDAIADESFLTGESVPICKSASQRSVVYSGTSILRSVDDTNWLPKTKFESLYRVKNLIKGNNKTDDIKVYKKTSFDNCAIGVVIATGFNTARGKIMKDIINPKPVKIPFLLEAGSYIFYTIILALILTILLSIYFKYVLEWPTIDNFIYSADLFFTLASPALYASLKVGIQISNTRLKEDGIQCNNTDRIFISGNIDMAIFDKTGTLTSEGMDFLCLDKLNFKTFDILNLDIFTRIGLSACHSVYELDGKYSGDALDIQMFIMSKSRLEFHNNIRKVILNTNSMISGPFLKEYGEETDKLFYQNISDNIIKSKNIESDNIITSRNIESDNIITSKNIESDNIITSRNIGSDNIITSKNIKSDNIITSKNIESDNIITSKNIKSYRENENLISILKTTDFTSESKRMSVILEYKGKKYYFTKGSPDVIQNLLRKVPDDYENKVKEHSLSGYRVISMAYKEILDNKENNINNDIDNNKENNINNDIDNNKDNNIENNLEFIGLVVFSNQLKPETFKVIDELNNANIRSAICTGDNILTAISVGRECGIIDDSITVIFPVLPDKCKAVYDVEWVCLGDEDLVFDKVRCILYKNNFDTYCNDFVIACEGKEYEYFKGTNYYNFILEKGKVFARFSPAQKKTLVEDFRNINKNVLFCGDGANDSGAIGTADVGIALAQNEASLASSFCARNINAVPLLIKECRNAYVTSISLFKYVSMSYFLAFVCLSFPVLRCLFLSDFQTLHVDIFIIVPMMIFISNFKKSDILHKVPPNISLFQIKELVPYFASLFLQILIIGILSCYGPGSSDISEESKAGTMIFFVTAFQSIFNAIYLSDAVPHRESVFQNSNLLIVSYLFMLWNLSLLFINWINHEFTLRMFSLYLFVEIDNRELGFIIMGILGSFIACFIVPLYTRKIFKH